MKEAKAHGDCNTRVLYRSSTDKEYLSETSVWFTESPKAHPSIPALTSPQEFFDLVYIDITLLDWAIDDVVAFLDLLLSNPAGT